MNGFLPAIRSAVVLCITAPSGARNARPWRSVCLIRRHSAKRRQFQVARKQMSRTEYGGELPEAFTELERFVPEWSLATEQERNRKRRTASMDDIRTFYDAMVRQIAAISKHLNAFSLQELPTRERRLLNLAFSFMEVAPAVEVYFSADVPDAIEAERLTILTP